MVDERNASRRREALSSSREWRGAAWTAVVALFAAAACRALMWQSSFSISMLHYVSMADYIAPILFLLALIFSKSRFRRIILFLWFFVSLLCVVAIFSQYPWGDGATDSSDEVRRQYFAFSFLSDGLFAFGSVILLLANVALIWAEWKQARHVKRP